MSTQETKKTERMFDLTVTGITLAGYTVTLAMHDVTNEGLVKALEWCDERMIALAVRPSLLPNDHSTKSAAAETDTKMCPIHNVPMERHEKGKSHWYSHKCLEGDLGEFWCRGKASG